MKPQTGLLLRLLGPLIQFACAGGLYKTWDKDYRVAGVPLDTLLYMGFAVGLMMVIAGLTMVKRTARRGRPPIRDLDLDRAARDPNH